MHQGLNKKGCQFVEVQSDDLCKGQSLFAKNCTFTFPFAILYSSYSSQQQYNIHWNNIWSHHHNKIFEYQGDNMPVKHFAI